MVCVLCTEKEEQKDEEEEGETKGRDTQTDR